MHGRPRRPWVRLMGYGRRAGLRAWPSMRRREAELVTRVAQAIDPDVFKDAFAAGSELNLREAVALVRGDRMMEV